MKNLQEKHLHRYHELLKRNDGQLKPEAQDDMKKKLDAHHAKLRALPEDGDPNDQSVIKSLDKDFRAVRNGMKGWAKINKRGGSKKNRGPRGIEELQIDFETEMAKAGRSDVTEAQRAALKTRVEAHNSEVAEILRLEKVLVSHMQANGGKPSETKSEEMRQRRKASHSEYKRIMHRLDLPARSDRMRATGDSLVDAARKASMPPRELEALRRDVGEHVASYSALVMQEIEAVENESASADSWDSAEDEESARRKEFQKSHAALKKGWRRLVHRAEKYTKAKEL